MPPSLELISRTTLSSTASVITFSSIPTTYQDLRIVLVCKGIGGESVQLNFNNDTSNAYSSTHLRGNGSAVSSIRYSNTTYIRVNQLSALSSTLFQTAVIDIPSYANTSSNKTCLIAFSRDTNGAGLIERSVGLRRDTSAINEIDFAQIGGTGFASGTVASLYGIKGS